jgi:colanic acid biosynthesis protein WcaH
MNEGTGNQGKHKAYLPAEDFARIVRLTPLASIDMALIDDRGMALLGKRTYEPAKGLWFVPGGRIAKDESLDDAFARILKAETGLALPRGRATFLGAYEHFYETNRFEETGYGTHYVVLGYRLQMDMRPVITADDQHSTLRWMTPDEILAAPDVHKNTKAYFR